MRPTATTSPSIRSQPVKSIFFHFMPYRDLPADFEQKYESVWVTPPYDELCDPALVRQYYQWTLDELELADRLGFDGIGVNEHHQNGYGFMPSPNVMAGALVRRTPGRSAICVIGNTLALYSPATRVAEEMAMLDVMSDGRLVAGFPVGTSMDVNFCYGVTPTLTRPRYREAVDLITQAWTRPGPFTFNGEFNQLRYVNPWPKPLQKPYPPVWLAGGGSVETWELAGERDWTYNYLSYFGYQLAQKVMGGFWETMDRMGLDRNPFRAGYSQQICVSETDARAKEEYLEHVLYFFNKCMHVAPGFRDAPGYRTRRSSEFALKTNTTAELVRMATMEKNWDTLVDNGLIIAGSPATVADRLIEAAKTLHVGNLIALLQIGSMPHDLTEKNITLFAEEVLPRIRTQWTDQGWEHKWWPKGAADHTPAATVQER
jgi:alkanesulfonate monooxygenase SsuD/methylene tetrahydromethanopterin reductase-like flavin-dependent oxidoreductase (luciferase family)